MILFLTSNPLFSSFLTWPQTVDALDSNLNIMATEIHHTNSGMLNQNYRFISKQKTFRGLIRYIWDREIIVNSKS